MQGRLIKNGFTLLELSISMLFVSLLSIAIVIVINNVISAYQRGAVISRLDGTGTSIVDDMRSAVQDAINRTRLGNNVSIIKKADNMTIDGIPQTDIPIYGIFCTGSYTYFWNSGYFFSDDATFEEKNAGWAKIQLSDDKDDLYNPLKISGKPAFRLVKVQDKERQICLDTIQKYADSKYVIDNNKLSDVFDISKLKNKEITTILQNDNDNDLALYDLLVEIPATNPSESLSLYNVSFILGTTTGGVDIATSGNSCAAPIDDPNWNNSCAVTKFSFVTESNASDVGTIEQAFYGEVPEKPEVEIPPQITYKNTNCPSNPLATHTEWNQGFVHQNNFFSCNDYNFVSWNTSQLGTGTNYQPGDSISATEDHILYAIWKPAPRITYKNDNCESNSHSPKIIKNTGVVLSYDDASINFTCADASFISWNTDVNGNGTSYSPGSSIAKDDITLFAIWKQKVYYHITYHGNGDTDSTGNILNSTSNSPNILEGNAYIIKNNSWQNRGYEFDSWNTRADGKGTTYAPGTSIVMNYNMDLYAQWRLEGAEPVYTEETVQPTDRFFDTIIVYPDTVMPGSTCYAESEGTICYLAKNITGQVDGSDTGIISDKIDFNQKSTQDICESFNSSNQCSNPHNDYILTVYKLFQNGTKSAIIFLKIENNRNINIDNTKERFAFYYNPSAYDVNNYASSGILYYNSIPGHTGYPSIWGCHPAIYYFPKLRDTLIATNFVSKKIEGKNATIENDKPKYWIIAKLNYQGSNLSITPINKFTNTDPNSF